MIPEPITETYGDFHSLRLSIDRYLRTLAYFNPKVVIYKNSPFPTWVLEVYKLPEWEAWKLKSRSI